MIKDKLELITEIVERSGVADVPLRAAIFIGLAEDLLSKKLRLAKMEKEAVLKTDAEKGLAALPADYQEIRDVRVGGATLLQKPINLVLGGHVRGYAVQSTYLRSTFKDAEHEILYYASVPSLNQNATTWLLADQPEVILQAVLFEVYTAQNDYDRAKAASDYLETLISAANQEDFAARYAGTTVDFGKPAP